MDKVHARSSVHNNVLTVDPVDGPSVVNLLLMSVYNNRRGQTAKLGFLGEIVGDMALRIGVMLSVEHCPWSEGLFVWVRQFLPSLDISMDGGHSCCWCEVNGLGLLGQSRAQWPSPQQCGHLLAYNQI